MNTPENFMLALCLKVIYFVVNTCMAKIVSELVSNTAIRSFVIGNTLSMIDVIYNL